MDTIWIILGIALTLAAVALVSSFAFRKKPQMPDAKPEQEAPPVRQLEEQKQETISAIARRHEEAAQVMEEAVRNITARCEVPENEDSALEEISNELDALLKED